MKTSVLRFHCYKCVLFLVKSGKKIIVIDAEYGGKDTWGQLVYMDSGKGCGYNLDTRVTTIEKLRRTRKMESSSVMLMEMKRSYDLGCRKLKEGFLKKKNVFRKRIF